MSITETIKAVQTIPSADFINAYAEVGRFPKSKRLIGDLIKITTDELNRNIKPLPVFLDIFNKRKCLIYQSPNKECLFGILREKISCEEAKGEMLDYYCKEGPHIRIFRKKSKILERIENAVLDKNSTLWELDAIEFSERYKLLNYDFSYCFGSKRNICPQKTK